MTVTMKVFICIDFNGHYPVGTAVVVVAETCDEAKRLLEWELRKEGFRLEVSLSDIHELDLSCQSCEILCDGNY